MAFVSTCERHTLPLQFSAVLKGVFSASQDCIPYDGIASNCHCRPSAMLMPLNSFLNGGGSGQTAVARPARVAIMAMRCGAGSTLNHWPFPTDHLHAGYAYIITHPGSPCIFYDHFMADDLGQSIRELITVRQKMRLQCRSKVKVLLHNFQPWTCTAGSCMLVTALCVRLHLGVPSLLSLGLA